MTTHRLVSIDGALYFPSGRVYLDPQGGDAPSLLLETYAAGDCDTCPWPIDPTRPSLLTRLASALYGERECNDRFKYGDTIELPDGTAFDFDALVS